AVATPHANAFFQSESIAYSECNTCGHTNTVTTPISNAHGNPESHGDGITIHNATSNVNTDTQSDSNADAHSESIAYVHTNSNATANRIADTAANRNAQSGTFANSN